MKVFIQPSASDVAASDASSSPTAPAEQCELAKIAERLIVTHRLAQGHLFETQYRQGAKNRWLIEAPLRFHTRTLMTVLDDLMPILGIGEPEEVKQFDAAMRATVAKRLRVLRMGAHLKREELIRVRTVDNRTVARDRMKAYACQYVTTIRHDFDFRNSLYDDIMLTLYATFAEMFRLFQDEYGLVLPL